MTLGTPRFIRIPRVEQNVHYKTSHCEWIGEKW